WRVRESASLVPSSRAGRRGGGGSCRSWQVRAGRRTRICDAGWASPGRRSGWCAPGAGRRPSRTWSARSRDGSRPASRLRPSPS
ncbi:MAG: hypothetical protein AVDCRST_MAG88-666, partial [uncultured Thermomicrobiales bacterium]